jgi:hypothetical protein
MIYSSAVKMEVVGSFKMLVPIYQTTQYHTLEGNTLNIKVLFNILLDTLAVTIINPILSITVFVLP